MPAPHPRARVRACARRRERVIREAVELEVATRMVERDAFSAWSQRKAEADKAETARSIQLATMQASRTQRLRSE